MSHSKNANCKQSTQEEKYDQENKLFFAFSNLFLTVSNEQSQLLIQLEFILINENMK